MNVEEICKWDLLKACCFIQHYEQHHFNRLTLQCLISYSCSSYATVYFQHFYFWCWSSLVSEYYQVRWSVRNRDIRLLYHHWLWARNIHHINAQRHTGNGSVMLVQPDRPRSSSDFWTVDSEYNFGLWLSCTNIYVKKSVCLKSLNLASPVKLIFQHIICFQLKIIYAF